MLSSECLFAKRSFSEKIIKMWFLLEFLIQCQFHYKCIEKKPYHNKNHDTLPFTISLLMYSPPLFTLIPFQATYPSASVLNKGRHRSRIFFFGLMIATFYSVKSCSWPSRTNLSSSFPFGRNSWITVCSSFDAQTTIPLDWNPANGLGLRFTITNTLPVICSRGTCCWRPDAISLTSPNI